MTIRVLLVDDSVDFLATATRLLERDGLTVVATARTGDDAVRIAGDVSPDVTLLDIDLGEESGFEVARRLHDGGEAAERIILISSHSPEDFVDLVAESPAAGFLSKSRLSAAAIREVLERGSSATP